MAESAQMSVVWCNGQWHDPGNFPGSPLDRGAILGLGLFETLLAIDGHVVYCDRHLARLQAGCARLGWSDPLESFPKLAHAMKELLQRSMTGNGRAKIRLALSAGSGPLADLTPGADSMLWMTASQLDEPPVSLTLTVSPWPRNERGALTGMKCAAYAENLLALDHAHRAGFDETLICNTSGDLCEAATSNIFLVRAGHLRTPPLASGCLPGVTRAVVIELAKRAGIPCEECRLQLGDLYVADEIILTAATRGPVVVSRFCDRSLKPSPMATRIRALWEEDISRKILA